MHFAPWEQLDGAASVLQWGSGRPTCHIACTCFNRNSGIRDSRVKQRLLREENLTLGKAVNICRAAGTAHQQLKFVDGMEVHQIKKAENFTTRKNKNWRKNKDDSRKSTDGAQNKTRNSCKRCGKSHTFGKCPAFNQICRSCNLKGHFEKYCLTEDKNMNIVKNERQENEADETSVFLGAILNEEKNVKNINSLQNVQIGDTDCIFKLDTGAETNVVPIH